MAAFRPRRSHVRWRWLHARNQLILCLCWLQPVVFDVHAIFSPVSISIAPSSIYTQSSSPIMAIFTQNHAPSATPYGSSSRAGQLCAAPQLMKSPLYVCSAHQGKPCASCITDCSSQMVQRSASASNASAISSSSIWNVGILYHALYLGDTRPEVHLCDTDAPVALLAYTDIDNVWLAFLPFRFLAFLDIGQHHIVRILCYLAALIDIRKLRDDMLFCPA